MTGELVAAEIGKYERALERSKKLGLDDYTEHFENILKELKAIQEHDKEFKGDDPLAEYRF